jgi:hypothetical protein
LDPHISLKTFARVPLNAPSDASRGHQGGNGQRRLDGGFNQLLDAIRSPPPAEVRSCVITAAPAGGGLTAVELSHVLQLWLDFTSANPPHVFTGIRVPAVPTSLCADFEENLRAVFLIPLLANLNEPVLVDKTAGRSVSRTHGCAHNAYTRMTTRD